MLGKVFKYELRACARLLVPFFAVVLVLAALLRGLWALLPMWWPPAAFFIENLAASLGMLLSVAVVLFCMAVTIVRFYQGMVGREAYLQFSLPVSANTHILGRLLSATLWTLAGFAVAILSVFFTIPGLFSAMIDPTLIGTGPGNAGAAMGLFDLPAPILFSLAGVIFVFILLCIVSNLAKFYASFAIGSQFGQNRLLGSFIGYIILNAASLVIVVPLLLIPAFTVLGSNNQEFMAYMSAMVSPNIIESMSNMLGFLWACTGILGTIILLLTALQYWLALHLFGKKLNLE